MGLNFYKLGALALTFTIRMTLVSKYLIWWGVLRILIGRPKVNNYFISNDIHNFKMGGY